MTGTLTAGEYHPAANSAMAYVRSRANLMEVAEVFASLALSGNRTAEVCSETLRRVMSGEPVSDRYLLGLAWTIHLVSAMEGVE